MQGPSFSHYHKEIEMRLLGLLCCSALLSSLSPGQLPNSGFENWSLDPDNNNNPVGWQTTNSYPIVNVEPYAPGHQGSYALRVKTVNVGLPLPGIAILQTPYLFSQTPTTFSAYVKSTIMPGDQALLIVALMRGDSVIASVDSCTFKISSTISEFTRLDFRIALQSNLVPDSIYVMVASGLLNPQPGTELIVDDIAFAGNGATRVVDEGRFPVVFSLAQNYPNPFNPSTAVDFSLEAPAQVTLKVCDVLGREVATLVNERKEPGSYTVRFSGEGLASGVYFYRLEAGSLTATRKMVLLK
jgi:hypothetical protein